MKRLPPTFETGGGLRGINLDQKNLLQVIMEWGGIDSSGPLTQVTFGITAVLTTILFTLSICASFKYMVARCPRLKLFVFSHDSLWWLQWMVINHDTTQNRPEGFVPNGPIVRAPTMYKVQHTESSDDTLSQISSDGMHTSRSSVSSQSNYSSSS